MKKATDLDIAQAKTMALSLDYYRQLRDKLSHEKAAELVIKCCNPNLSVRQVKKNNPKKSNFPRHILSLMCRDIWPGLMNRAFFFFYPRFTISIRMRAIHCLKNSS